MSEPTSTPRQRPLLSKDGNHWLAHGAAVRHRQRGGEATDHTLSVVSYRARNSRASVMLEQTCLGGPAAMFFHLSPDDAEATAKNLLQAAQCARELQAVIDGGQA